MITSQQYTKVKTKKDKLVETGLAINFCKITVSFKKGVDRTVDMVYKAIKIDANLDTHFLKRVKSELKLNDKIQFRVKKVQTLKFLGYGIYEE